MWLSVSSLLLLLYCVYLFYLYRADKTSRKSIATCVNSPVRPKKNNIRKSEPGRRTPLKSFVSSEWISIEVRIFKLPINIIFSRELKGSNLNDMLYSFLKTCKTFVLIYINCNINGIFLLLGKIYNQAVKNVNATARSLFLISHEYLSAYFMYSSKCYWGPLLGNLSCTSL